MTHKVGGCVLFATLALLAPLSPQATAEGFDIENFRPVSPGDGELLSVHSTRVVAPGQLALSLSLGVVDDPLVIVDENGNRIAEVIHQRTATELMAAYGVGRVEFFAALPFILSQDADADAMAGIEELRGGGIGDARLGLRASLPRSAGQRFGAGAGLQVSAPTAAGAEFSGASGLSASPFVAADWHAGPVLVVANLGARLRGKEQLGNLRVGSALTYGAGVSTRVSSTPLWLVAELNGEMAGASTEKAPLEGRGALRGEVSPSYFGQVGYGRGLIHGYGAPDHRFLATLTYRPALPAKQPALQTVEGAPLVARPENPDPDGDGIASANDECPYRAEDFDGFDDHDGCPESDNDNDGVADDEDKCRNNAEDLDGFEDDDGCPDPDNDRDGLLDSVDQCPNQAEVINGVDDDDGCPDEGEALVVVGTNKLLIKDSVYFAHNKAEILDRSNPLLDQIAKTLARANWIKKVRVEGHTDDRGNNAYNRELSDKRASAVMQALIARGIDKRRLEAKGYGEDAPIDSNKTAAGRASNRRVEFLIVDQQEQVAPAMQQGAQQ